MDPQMRVELRRWLESASQFSVEVTEPRQSGGLAGLGSTWTFTVNSHSVSEGHITVLRQYKEFFQLRDLILQRYQGIIVSDLPHDNKRVVMGAAKDAVLHKRADVLTIFLSSLASNPFVAQDDLFLGFLRNTTHKFTQLVSSVDLATKRQKNEAKRHGRSFDDSGLILPKESPEWWVTACRLTEYPSDPLTTILDALGELEQFSKSMVVSKNAFKKIRERAAASAQAYEELTVALDRWQVLERSSRLFSSALVPVADTIYSTAVFREDASGSEKNLRPAIGSIEMLRKKVNSHGESVRHYGTRIDGEILPMIRFELLLIQGAVNQLYLAKEKMEKRIEAQRMCDLLLNEIDVFNAKHQSATKGVVLQPKFLSRKKQLEKQLADARFNMSLAEDKTEDFLCASLAVELPKLLRERAVRSHEICEKMCEISLAVSQAEFSCWCSDTGRVSVVRGSSNPQSFGSVFSLLEHVRSSSSTETNVLGDNSPSDSDAESCGDEPDMPFPAIILYNFEAEHADELSVQRGQHGTVHPFEPDENWVMFTLHPESLMVGDQAQGLVPRSYIQPIGEKSDPKQDDSNATGSPPPNMRRTSIPRMDLMLSEIVKEKSKQQHANCEGEQVKQLQTQLKQVADEKCALERQIQAKQDVEVQLETIKREKEKLSSKLDEMQGMNEYIEELASEKKQLYDQLQQTSKHMKELEAQREVHEKAAKLELEFEKQQVVSQVREELLQVAEQEKKELEDRIRRQMQLVLEEEREKAKQELEFQLQRNKKLENVVEALQMGARPPPSVEEHQQHTQSNNSQPFPVHVKENDAYPTSIPYEPDVEVQGDLHRTASANSSYSSSTTEGRPSSDSFGKEEDSCWESNNKMETSIGDSNIAGKGAVESNKQEPIWIKAFDESYQRNYYYNTITKVSSWIKPDDFEESNQTVFVDK